MSLILSRHWYAATLLSLSIVATAYAQKPVVDVYRSKVVMKDGSRFRGLLVNITNSYLYLGKERRRQGSPIPLDGILKVVIHRQNKKNALMSGAIIGGLFTGYLSNKSLQKNQPSTPVTYGLTLTFAAAGGAAAGLLVGSAIGNLTSRVIRPHDVNNPEISLYNQLEPFTTRYQQDLINRLPTYNP